MKEVWVKADPWQKKVVVRTTDWNVIPLENLVARARNIFVEADSLEGARMALTVLEKGVDGLVVTATDPVRVKTEQRPLLLMEAMGPEGPVSVVNLQPGDVVLGRVEAAGRHFGHKINESIIEN